MAELNWTEERYWRVHEQLVDSGRVERGRGRGGSVLLVSVTSAGVSAAEAASELPGQLAINTSLSGSSLLDARSELSLYDAIKVQLTSHWGLRHRFAEIHCEITALQGRRDTGGSWSRPDLCVIGARTFEHYPGRQFELHTFEVKGSNDVTIKGVLEALSHREAATRSYALYHTNGQDFTSYPESPRIVDLANRFGVGLIAAYRIDDINTWDEIVPAQLANFDPVTIDNFISRSLSMEAKAKIRWWFQG